MIKEEQLIEVGHILKTHGLKGELNVAIDDPVFDEVERCDYFVCEMDGIFVPFFFDSYRWRGDGAILLQLEEIDTKEKADAFCGKTLYFDRRCFSSEEEEEYDANNGDEEMGLIGYQVMDVELGMLGEITDINDQTANILFVVDHEGEELLIPAAEDLIVEIDDENQIVRMQLPNGLVNLDDAESDE